MEQVGMILVFLWLNKLPHSIATRTNYDCGRGGQHFIPPCIKIYKKTFRQDNDLKFIWSMNHSRACSLSLAPLAIGGLSTKHVSHVIVLHQSRDFCRSQGMPRALS